MSGSQWTDLRASSGRGPEALRAVSLSQHRKTARALARRAGTVAATLKWLGCTTALDLARQSVLGGAR